MDPLRKKEMLAFLDEQECIEHVYNVLSLQMGSDVMIAIKAKMQEKESAQDLVKDINAAESAFRERFPEVRWLFFEPDSHD